MKLRSKKAPRTILITGAGSGLGNCTARLFAARGWTVLAADLNPPAVDARIVPIELDVTDAESVAAGIERVTEFCPNGLGGVITFAGIVGVGPLVEVDPDSIAKVLEVNVMGTVRTVQGAFPLVREGGGRIVVIGSETGWQHAMPFNGPYAMSKHAIEAYADALRRELMFLGIKVVLVQPGPFRTGMTAGLRRSFEDSLAPNSPFAGLVNYAADVAVEQDSSASDPEILARAAWKAVTTALPKNRYSVKPHRGRALLDQLPVPVVDTLAKVGLQRHL